MINAAHLAVPPAPTFLFYGMLRSMSDLFPPCAGLVSVAGITLGNLGNALAAALGLAALFAVSALAFTVIKYAGALYLVYLGVQMLRATDNGAAQAEPMPASLRRIFRDGVVVSLLNPKTTVFFAAFLPQFMSPAVAPLPQSMALGALFVAIAAVTDSLYALAAGSVAPALTQLRGTQTSSWLSLGRRAGGGLFIGLGVFTALTGQRK